MQNFNGAGMDTTFFRLCFNCNDPAPNWAPTTLGLGLRLELGFPSVFQFNLERRLVEETLG